MRMALHVTSRWIGDDMIRDSRRRGLMAATVATVRSARSANQREAARRLGAILMATATVAVALTVTTNASAAPAGEGVSTRGPGPAFSYCEKTYTVPYMSGGDRIMANGWYVCNGPDP